MTTNTLALIAIISPLLFSITALASHLQPGMRPTLVQKLGRISTLLSIIIAALSGYLVFQYGLLETSTFGFQGIGISLRIDALSSLMFGMIALLGYIVMRFSQTYLDGDERHGIFLGRLAAAIASVQLIVLSGNLGLLMFAWVFTSMSLHKLLTFYHERPGAIIAARKKFFVARLGDASLLAAITFLYLEFGTGNLEQIFQGLKFYSQSGIQPTSIEYTAICLVIAALLKSAQFPTHGWLLEVMETPTPVSALLHAGLLNAGPFIIIRMAHVMDASTYAPLALISLGGFTALFASVVYLTQTSVKTALGYSSVAHMGFSLMVCGLGVYSAAMLHLVAHSFYKAHSFLSSGSAIDTLRSAKVTSSKRLGNPLRITLGIFLGLTVYFGNALLWGVDPAKDTALFAIGSIIALGLSRMFSSALDSTSRIPLLLRVSFISVLVSTAFFSLEAGMEILLSNELPELSVLNTPKLVFIGLVLSLFAATIFIQIATPFIRTSTFTQNLSIHLKNGLYANVLFDRIVGALKTENEKSLPVIIEQKDVVRQAAYSKSRNYEQQPA